MDMSVVWIVQCWAAVTQQGNKEPVGGLECSPAGNGSVHKPDLMCKQLQALNMTDELKCNRLSDSVIC